MQKSIGIPHGKCARTGVIHELSCTRKQMNEFCGAGQQVNKNSTYCNVYVYFQGTKIFSFPCYLQGKFIMTKREDKMGSHLIFLIES